MKERTVKHGQTARHGHKVVKSNKGSPVGNTGSLTAVRNPNRPHQSGRAG